jgi:dihydrofolate reductase
LIAAAMPGKRHIEGYAIVSDDGMLANSLGVMPDSLSFKADHDFFTRGLDGVDLVVQGRHSHEHQPKSALRPRIILTRKQHAVARDPFDAKAVLWNPAGASFEEALDALGPPNSRIGIIGGTECFGLFLDRYDVFFLSRAPGVRLPNGRPVFPGVPAKTPEQVMAEHGLQAAERQVLDANHGIAVTGWRRGLPS